ncbi:putative metal-dependent hydrolase YjjV [Celerinatantimonas diazotrophica]|nr:putative metal-dependent hydrolase YjjV [Celerinatantimonas diazotrophica]
MVPAIGPENWQRVMDISAQHSQIMPALGIHPCFSDGFSSLGELSQWVERYRQQIVAIGECGLDRRFKETMERQKKVFIEQLRLAQQFDLPVTIHSVRMNDEIYALLKQYPLARGGVIHAFQGSLVQAQAFIKLGFKLGIGGAITWPRSGKLREVVATIGPENLVLETDSPDMPIVGQRKGENTPATICFIFEILSSVLVMRPEFLSEVLYKNSRDIFFAS